jgi:drug/metabolite transporter (DMT)-like permease
MKTGSGMDTLTWSLLLLLGIIWGGSFFLARIAVHEVPPFTLVFLRLSIAAVALHLYIGGRFGIYALFRLHWRQFLLLGLINNAVPHALIFLGETEIGAGLASVLNATTPIWTVVIARYLTEDERPTAAKLLGCLVGLAGTIVLVGPAMLVSNGAPSWALLAPILAAVSYGFAAIYAKRFKGVPAPVTAAGQLTGSSLIMCPVSFVADRPWTLAAPSSGTVAAIVALALVSTAFAYILYFRIMALAGATNASLVTLLVPAGAILLGAVFLGERLTATDVAGMLLIAVGLLLLDGRLFDRMRPRSRPA